MKTGRNMNFTLILVLFLWGESVGAKYVWLQDPQKGPYCAHQKRRLGKAPKETKVSDTSLCQADQEFNWVMGPSQEKFVCYQQSLFAGLKLQLADNSSCEKKEKLSVREVAELENYLLTVLPDDQNNNKNCQVTYQNFLSITDWVRNNKTVLENHFIPSPLFRKSKGLGKRVALGLLMDEFEELRKKVGPEGMVTAKAGPLDVKIFSREIYVGVNPGKPVGTGSFKKVFEVKDGQGKRFVNFTFFKSDRPTPAEAANFRNAAKEASLYRMMMNEKEASHVVPVQEVFSGKKMISVVQTYLEGGDGHTFIEKILDADQEQGKNEKLRQDLQGAYDMVRGLSFLHSKGIIHKDIKLDNIYFDQKGRAFIGDLGTSYKIDDPQTASNKNEFSGTLAYLAPEYIKMFRTFDPSFSLKQKMDPLACIDRINDQFAMGIVLYNWVTFSNVPWVSDYYEKHQVDSIDEKLMESFLREMALSPFDEKQVDHYLKDIDDTHPLKPLIKKLLVSKNIRKESDLKECEKNLLVDMVGFFEKETDIALNYNLLKD